MNDKTLAIAKALSSYYGIELPEFYDSQECHQWIKSVLSKNNAQIRRCHLCNHPLVRKPINGKLRYLCKNCGKTYDIKHFTKGV